MLSVRPRPAINAVFLFHETLVLMLIPSNFRTRMSQNIPLSGREILAEFSSTNLEQLESAAPWSGNPRNCKCLRAGKRSGNKPLRALAKDSYFIEKKYTSWCTRAAVWLIGSAHDVTLKSKLISFLLYVKHEFDSAKFHATCCVNTRAWTKIFLRNGTFSENRVCHARKPLRRCSTVSASDSKKSPSVWRRPVSGWERRRRRRFLEV